jgi:3-methyl-2-oxobutanoate hydroxymethyltransferase
VVVDSGAPVMAHVGLTLQLMAAPGGFRVEGKGAVAGVQLPKEAMAIAQAGCFAIVLGAMPDRVARLVTGWLRTPTFGAGPRCIRRIPVLHAGAGLFDRCSARLVKRNANRRQRTGKALTDFQDGARSDGLPTAERSFMMKK